MICQQNISWTYQNYLMPIYRKGCQIELGVNDGCKISELKKWSDNIYYLSLIFRGQR